jgi:23S rRNA pseudouridine1911/1915/1917 synthase
MCRCAGAETKIELDAFVVAEENAGHRLDFVISRELGISRAYAQHLIKNGRVASRSGRRVKASIKVEAGEFYEVDMPSPQKLDIEPEDVPFGVVYSDSDVIVLDKPAGLVVHPAPGHWNGTLVHGLLYRFPELGNLNGVERPGIVHRLDATTSGLMVVARSGLAQEKLWSDFKSRRVGKTYLALCRGVPRDKKARIDLPIGRDLYNRRRMAVVEDGRDAVTEYDVLWSRNGYSLVMCSLLTGRTHQIRVHMRAIGCPLAGDALYSGKDPAGPAFAGPRVFLHSWRLSFVHPRTGEKLSFKVPLPDDLKNFLLALR